MKAKILIITPVDHIQGLVSKLNSFADVTFKDDPSREEVLSIIEKFDAIFTNPNKSKIFLDKEIIDAAIDLKVICTASTGTNHIDIEYVKSRGIKIISLTDEREAINKISSTAEHAFALTLSSLRHVVNSFKNVLEGEWDYEKYIGRQMNGLTIGVVGFGRLGSMYSDFCLAFGSRVLIYDPYKSVSDDKFEKVDLKRILYESDIISLHVHVNEETMNMVNMNWFNSMKSEVLIVNTSRGEIIHEEDLVKFLEKNSNAKYATDVLANEILDRKSSPILKYSYESNQVIITPHIGGMTKEAQEIAFHHAADLLINYFNSN